MPSLQLKHRFVIAIAAVYLMTGAAALWSFSWLANDVVDAMGRGLARRQAQYSRAQCLAPLARELALARMMARSPSLRDWAKQEQDPELRRRALTEMELYRQNFRDGSYFFAMQASGNYYFNDAAGAYSGNEKRYTLDPSKSDDGWYYATLRSGLDYQLNVNPDVNLKVTKVWINVLMREGDRVLGVLGTGLDLSGFIRDVVESDQPGVETLFIDAKGAIQAYKDVSKIDFASVSKRPADQATLQQLLATDAERRALAEALARVEASDAVEVLPLTLDGRKLLVGVASMKEIGWRAVALIDPEQLLRQGPVLWVSGLIGLALLVALSAAGLALDRLVLSRLRRLSTAIHAVGAGADPAALDVGPQDEIGALARSFQDMATTVRRQTVMLERRAHGAEADHELARRRLEARTDELVRANAELEHFAYGVSHDLRQPLRMIVSYLGLLQRRLEAVIDRESRQYIGYAVDGAKRMERMIAGVLEFSRTGRTEAPGAPVDLSAALADAMRSIEEAAREADAQISTPTTAALTLGHRDELVRLFENLLSNAVKYRDPSRLLSIEVIFTEDDAEWEIQLRDNGQGIPAEDLERVFMVFQRGAHTASSDSAGVGLSVCRKIVEHHGGRLWVESRVGVGSCFFVRLPKWTQHWEDGADAR